MSHTPGPWVSRFSENGGYDCMTDAYHIHAQETPFIVVSVDLGSYGQSQRTNEISNESRARAEADARLIAAAPEMLDALKGIVGLVQLIESREPELQKNFRYRDALKAILKAEAPIPFAAESR